MNPRDRSPQFMRRVRNRPALRRRSNLAVFMQLSLVSLGIALGGAIGWLGSEYVSRNQTFRLAEFQLDEVPAELQPAVESVLSPAYGANLLTFDLSWMQRQVGRIPAVKSATVRRVLPDKVSVSVVPRTPFARLDAMGWSRAISRDGVILSSAQPAGDLPVIRSALPFDVGEDRQLPGSITAEFESAATLLEWLPEADRDLYANVDHIRIEVRGVVVVLEQPQWEIVFGDSAQLDARLRGMVDVVQAEHPGPTASIDLRYAGQVVINAPPDQQEY
ncbi:MAG: FtsQ-type POTRA domain-containing protein [Acidobacteria bacterium]|nr:FtsQ-type POTRA domain-containing protein [Acidobacteriota bacterium]